MKEFISVDEAESIIAAHVRTMSAEFVSLDSSYGRTLSGSILSEHDIPPFDNSAMDGFAVRASEVDTVPVELSVSQEIRAGGFPRDSLLGGTCARILTGAPIPSGADAVVPVEWTEGDDPVRFLRSPSVGHAIRLAGEDVAAGHMIFSGGETVTPPVIGMLAAVGCSDVPVSVRPACSIIATGDELVRHDRQPERGQIRNSNGPALVAQVVSAGGRVARELTARDNPSSLNECLTASLGNDLVILSGGVSVGAYDHVKDVLDNLGVRLLFWKVKQRPGKPLVFGVRGETLVFGLPGNPVSSSICFDRYVRTTIARMLGRSTVERHRRIATLAESMTKVRGLQYFARGYLRYSDDNALLVVPTGPQGSGIHSSIAHADCIIHLPEEMENPEPGVSVEVEPLTW